MKKKEELPIEVVKQLNASATLNIFGLVNISYLKAVTGCTLSDKTLKRLIQEKYGKEMLKGKVEFVENNNEEKTRFE